MARFYHHLLVVWSALSRYQPFIPWTRHVSPGGKMMTCSTPGVWVGTSYPIIDATMRYLAQTGWMHNRLRMISASFLVKDLLIDWQLAPGRALFYVVAYY